MPEGQKCTAMVRLINTMKEKIKIRTKHEQVQILTITPESWSIRKTCQEFEVSKHLVRQGRKLCCKKRLLAKPDNKKGQQIPQIVKDKELEFYQLDDSARLCPVVKNVLSVFLNGKKVHKQKRLILLHLQELYIEFKKMFFFNCYLAAPRPTLGHYQGGSLTHPMLITAFLYTRPEGH